MQEYRIDKIRRAVVVTLTDGRQLSGEVFLQPIARLHTSPEEPIDLLNGAEPFFALAGDAEFILLAKEHVATLETAPPPDSPFDFPHLGVDVEIVLADGAPVNGCVFPETPAGRSRLLDFFNSFDQRFLAVHSADKVCLVNRRLIACVRQLS